MWLNLIAGLFGYGVACLGFSVYADRNRTDDLVWAIIFILAGLYNFALLYI